MQTNVSCGVRTHALLPAVDLKSTPLTTRANCLLSNFQFVCDLVCHIPLEQVRRVAVKGVAAKLEAVAIQVERVALQLEGLQLN